MLLWIVPRWPAEAARSNESRRSSHKLRLWVGGMGTGVFSPKKQPAPGSVPQQFVDGGLGAGPGVDALDDDRAGEARPAVLRRQRTRHDDRISRDAAGDDLAAGAVD